jgi:hypothetical protein
MGAHVDARVVAGRQTCVALDAAGAVANGIAAFGDRTRGVTRCAVRGVAFEVDAFATAVFDAFAALFRAAALGARLPGGATVTAGSAVFGVSRSVDARAAAASEASVAGDVARAGDAARARVGWLDAGSVALSTMSLVGARIHANGSARGEAVVTRGGAHSGLAACGTVGGYRTSRVAGAAVRVRNREIDASPVAVGRARRARVAALARGAYLAEGAALVTGAAVLGVAREVDARIATFLEARVATAGTSTELAGCHAVGQRSAADAAIPAVRRVPEQIRADSVTIREAFVAHVVAAAVRAGRSRPWRRRARGATRSAIFWIAGDDDAASVAHGFSFDTSDGAAATGIE